MAAQDVESAKETTALLEGVKVKEYESGGDIEPSKVSTKDVIKDQFSTFQTKYGSVPEDLSVVCGIPKRHLKAGSFAVMLILLGIYGGHELEGWSYVTSAYVIVQIVTTVGYGDLTVHGPSTKFIMALYSLVVMVLGGYYLNLFAQSVAAQSQDRARERLKQVVEHGKEEAASAEAELIKEDTNESTPRRIFCKLRSTLGINPMAPLVEKVKQRFSSADQKVLFAALWFIGFVAFGTFFFRYWEACSCSYGSTFVTGCREPDFKTCIETGGIEKTWQACFYMSIVTLLTIGFGDHSPKSWFGRIVGCVWMLIGVVRTANFVGTISDWFFSKKEESDFSDAVNEAVEKFSEIDKDGSGSLSRGEFLSFMIVQHNLVPQDMVDQLNTLFDDLERLSAARGCGDGSVQLEDLQNVMSRVAGPPVEHQSSRRPSPEPSPGPSPRPSAQP